MLVVGDESTTQMSWTELSKSEQESSILVPIRPVNAIVVTQDCDSVNGVDITLCEIRPFAQVEGMAKSASTPKAWRGILTRQARLNQKWSYLPPDVRLGFAQKMAVDYRVTLRLPRLDLEQVRHLRKGRLNDVADEHFRERIADFFRRYPYDEWYPLDDAELDDYRRDYPDAQAFPWQKRTPPAA